MSEDPNLPKGFAGLNRLLSEVDTEPGNRDSKPVGYDRAQAAPPAASEQIGGTHNAETGRSNDVDEASSSKPASTDETALNPNHAGIPGWFLAVFAICVVCGGLYFGALSDKSNQGFSESQASATPPAAPASTAVSLVKIFYTVRGSDGRTFEVEGPEGASPEQINAIALASWTPADVFLPEERPELGGGVLNDNQIRYCLAQKIRIAGWKSTVDSYDQGSVDAFNLAINDYNLRCSSFQYRSGALERVQTEVNSRLVALTADGSSHLGPRPPPPPPTFRKISTRTVASGGVQIASSNEKPDATDAIQNLFSLMATDGFAKTSAFEISLFESVNFKLNSAPHLVIFLKTRMFDPATKKLVDCHACGAKISAVVYRQTDKNWEPIGAGKEFAEIGGWGDAVNSKPIRIISNLASKTTAFLVDGGGSGQGYTNTGKTILAMVVDQWKPLGFIDLYGDNAGACDDKPTINPDTAPPLCWSYEGKLSVLETNSGGFRDILVTRTGTTAGRGRDPLPAANVIYRYTKEGIYLPDAK